MTDLSPRETAARALRHYLGCSATSSKGAADAVLAAVAAHDGLAEVIAAHDSCGWRAGGRGEVARMGCGMDLPPAGPSLRTAHLADVVRAWMVQP